MIVRANLDNVNVQVGNTRQVAGLARMKCCFSLLHFAMPLHARSVCCKVVRFIEKKRDRFYGLLHDIVKICVVTNKYFTPSTRAQFGHCHLKYGRQVCLLLFFLSSSPSV